ncbi:MAG: Colicin receptor precursor [Pseudomonadota bacterium]
MNARHVTPKMPTQAAPQALCTAALLLGLLGAHAARAQSPAPAAPAADMGTIEVQGQRDNDQIRREQSSASKIVIGREEIERQGDATVGEVLRRLPGVTVQGAPGRGGAIRMRGLGGGYTQILLDGERVPPGFSIDSLTPAQIERIEVQRAPTADTGARAVAGTINIILREGRRNTPDDLQLGASLQHDNGTGTLSWVHNLRTEGMTGTFSVNASQGKRPDENSAQTQFRDDQQNWQGEREEVFLSDRRAVHANARLQWRGEQGRTLTLMPFVVASDYSSRSDVTVQRTGTYLVDGVPTTGTQRNSATTQTDSRFGMLRLNGVWAQRLSSDDRLELRFGVGQSSYDMARQTNARTNGPLLVNRQETQDFSDDSWNLTGKWTRIIGEGHQWVSGLELEGVKRLERGGSAEVEDGGDLQASSQRWAIYTQDEFRINPNWSAYAGLRHENITTEGTLGDALKRNESSVTTPLLHALYKPDPKRRDQIRMSLTRSYKTPTLYNLIARYVPSILENSATRPDRVGNPDLKPELSTGVDVAFERYLDGGGVLSANVFHRRLTDHIRYTTGLETQMVGGVTEQRWVSRPTNVGQAWTQGLELEAKFRLNQLLPEAPAIDIRSNASFFRSRVLSVPGPNNRLDQQPDMTANLGADYRLRGMPLTLGGNLNFNPDYDTRRTDIQWRYQGIKQVVDVYGLWRFSPAAALRLTVSNLVPRDHITGSTFNNGTTLEQARNNDHNWRTIMLRLELKI